MTLENLKRRRYGRPDRRVKFRDGVIRIDVREDSYYRRVGPHVDLDSGPFIGYEEIFRIDGKEYKIFEFGFLPGIITIKLTLIEYENAKGEV